MLLGENKLLLRNQSKYVDRDLEYDKITSQISGAQTASIHIVYAATAIGKTYLSLKLLEEYQEAGLIKLRIPTPPENEGSQHQEWKVLDALFDKIDKQSAAPSNGILSFKEYLRQDEVVSGKALEGLLNVTAAATLKKGLLHGLLSRMLSVNEYDPNTFVLDDSLQSQMIRKAYLKYVFSCYRFLVIIDNLQNIDNSSLESLLDILQATGEKRHFLLFEYTLTEKTTEESLGRMIDFICTYGEGLAVDHTPLPPMPRKYVVDVVNHAKVDKPLSFNFNMDLLRFYDESARGNLKQVVEYTANYDSQTQPDERRDETLESILSVGNNKALYILALVIRFQGVLPLETLRRLECYFYEKYNYDALYELLVSARLILPDTAEELRLDHASISDSWRRAHLPLLNNIDTVVCEVLERYYTDCFNSNRLSIQELPWLALLELYRDRYPERIPSMMQHLREGILKNVSPQTAWEFLNTFAQATRQVIPQYISNYYEILITCFEFELYKEGYSCVQLMESFFSYPSEHRLLFHKMMYLSALDQHQDCIELYERYLDNYPQGGRERLNLSLIAQASFRAMNQIDRCKHIHDEIKADKRYRDYKEYGYFLRIANMYLPRRRAVAYLRKSYHFFLKRGMIHQAGKSAISYSHIVSSLGRLRQGQALILKAEALLIDKIMGSHMILVNKAVIKLHRDQSDRSIWNYLSLAEKSTRVSFDQLAVQIGKLIWCMINKDYDACPPIVCRINQLAEVEPDKHIVAMAYYDLYLYYKDCNEPDEAKRYWDMAYPLRLWAPAVQARMEHKYSWNERFLLKKPWGIAFLEYWTYDLLY